DDLEQRGAQRLMRSKVRVGGKSRLHRLEDDVSRHRAHVCEQQRLFELVIVGRRDRALAEDVSERRAKTAAQATEAAGRRFRALKEGCGGGRRGNIARRRRLAARRCGLLVVDAAQDRGVGGLSWATALGDVLSLAARASGNAETGTADGENCKYRD